MTPAGAPTVPNPHPSASRPHRRRRRLRRRRPRWMKRQRRKEGSTATSLLFPSPLSSAFSLAASFNVAAAVRFFRPQQPLPPSAPPLRSFLARCSSNSMAQWMVSRSASGDPSQCGTSMPCSTWSSRTRAPTARWTDHT
ncbi:hypothetical protein BS78_10G191900 [Paspalum vaginatum]|nr:hypothetical protein BS78_10G191900 [Paspalum vaginatum]